MTDLNQAVPDGIALDGDHDGTGFTRALELGEVTGRGVRAWAHRDGRLVVVAQPVRQGRTRQVWEVRTTRADDGRLVSTGPVRLQHVARRPT